MTTLQAALLGVLQGLTEFIPVSSSGHLVIIPWLLGWPSPGLSFDVLVHLGTLVALLLYFRRDIYELLLGAWELCRRRRLETFRARLLLLILLSALPAALLGYLLEDKISQAFETPWVASLFLLVTGGLLFTSEWLGKRTQTIEQLGWGQALLIGLAQSLALLPGISRSGATISAGLLCGLKRPAAARFSFLMVLPVILGATAFELLQAAQGGALAGSWQLGVGFLAALLSGYAALGFLIRHLQSHSLRPFAYYCWALGTLGLILSWVH
ncbi:MAG: undecaprenyl-diphosphatase UppP [Anaerolineae bacterium]|nr:undecaprenyl-diphosphatase UppP [Anaerolineae bacterium]